MVAVLMNDAFAIPPNASQNLVQLSLTLLTLGNPVSTALDVDVQTHFSSPLTMNVSW